MNKLLKMHHKKGKDIFHLAYLASRSPNKLDIVKKKEEKEYLNT